MALDAVLVFLGGGLGAVSRWLFGRAALRLAGAEFPLGTLAVNLLGSLLIGIVAGLAGRGALGAKIRLVAAAGFLGGFTTFSTLSLGSFELWRAGHWKLALAQLCLSGFLGPLLAGFGWAWASGRVGL